MFSTFHIQYNPFIKIVFFPKCQNMTMNFGIDHFTIKKPCVFAGYWDTNPLLLGN